MLRACNCKLTNSTIVHIYTYLVISTDNGEQKKRCLTDYPNKIYRAKQTI